jgi:hypothetical protein
MVTVFVQRGVLFRALMHQAQLEQSCFQRAIQEPYNGNHQQPHFIPHFIQKGERRLLYDGHRLFDIQQVV